MRAHMVQLDIAWEDKPANRDRAEKLIAAAAPSPGDLVILPEMFETGFSVVPERTADTDGAAVRWLSDLSRAHNIAMCAGITAMGQDGRGRNRAVLVVPGREGVVRYDKVHPFSPGAERKRFTGGEEVVVAELPVGGGVLRVCPIVCYDLRFPELFRAGRSLGAEAFIVIANWPEKRQEHWRTLLQARAIENQAIVVGVNRSGRDPYLVYAGGSIAFGPKGETLAEAGRAEEVVSAALDPDAVRVWRSEFDVFADARAGLMPRLREAASGPCERRGSL